MSKSISIGGVSYDILADASQFQEAMVITANERRKAAKIIRSTMTAEEELQQNVDALTKAYASGTITQAQYDKGLKKLKTDFEGAEEAAEDLAEEIEDIGEAAASGGRMFKGMADMKAGLSMVGGVVKGGFESFKEQVDEVRTLERFSTALKVNINDLQAFGMMAKQSGKDADVMYDILREIDMRAAEAATGTGEAAEAMERLGISSEEYFSADTAGKYKMVAEAVSGLTDVGEQVFALGQLAGGEAEDFLSVFQKGPGIFDSNRAAVKEFGLELDELTRENMRKASQEMLELEGRWSGLKRQAVSEFAGDAAILAEAASGSLGYLASIRNWARDTSIGGSWMASNTRGDIASQQSSEYLRTQNTPEAREELAKRAAAERAANAQREVTNATLNQINEKLTPTGGV